MDGEGVLVVYRGLDLYSIFFDVGELGLELVSWR